MPISGSHRPHDARALVSGERVYLRAPTAGDEDEFLAFVRASRGLHAGLVSPPATAETFAAYLERASTDAFASLLDCRLADGSIVGVFNLTIFRGPFQNAFLGYYANAAFSGRGYMSEGLRLTVRHAFGALGLHRLEANIQPHNVASSHVAKAAGFRLEGHSPRYLKVDGEWRDHDRFAITAEEVDLGGDPDA